MFSENINVCPPPSTSYLGKDGYRYTKLYLDVMRGERFVKQIAVTVRIHFDYSLGKYMVDRFLDDIVKDIIKQYPSLGGGIFIPTTNRVMP